MHILEAYFHQNETKPQTIHLTGFSPSRTVLEHYKVCILKPQNIHLKGKFSKTVHDGEKPVKCMFCRFKMHTL